MAQYAAARPAPTDYAAYYERYVSLVPEDDALAATASQLEETLALLRAIPEERGDYRYGPDKWTIKQVVAHMVDTERIFAYRALCFARGDERPLAGFDQEEYDRMNPVDHRTLADLTDEFEHVRRANLAMYRGLTAEAWDRRGTASENGVSVRALAHLSIGHERHHVGILRERYL